MASQEIRLQLKCVVGIKGVGGSRVAPYKNLIPSFFFFFFAGALYRLCLAAFSIRCFWLCYNCLVQLATTCKNKKEKKNEQTKQNKRMETTNYDSTICHNHDNSLQTQN